MRSTVVVALGLLAAVGAQGQQKQGPKTVEVTLTARGADPDPAKAATLDTVVWKGKDWRVKFDRKLWFFKRTPCKGKKEQFSSEEPEDRKKCVVEVVCKKADGCRYKYKSKAEGGPWIDPEIEVEPGFSNR